MRYEIDQDNFAIKIFNDNEDVPFQYQPDYPNGDKFDSYEEAENWALASIASHNEDCEFFAPDGKNIAPKKKPTEEEIAVHKLARIGLSVSELKNLLGIN